MNTPTKFKLTSAMPFVVCKTFAQNLFLRATRCNADSILMSKRGKSHFLQRKVYLNTILLLFALLFTMPALAQLPVPFTPRLDGGSIRAKGDVVFIGNNIITGAGLPLPYNGTAINNNQEGVYINVASGGDPSIFSSSSADLILNTDYWHEWHSNCIVQIQGE